MSHLIEQSSGWSLWRWIWIRAAGFPARGVLDLAGPDAAVAADRLLACEREAAGVRATVLEELGVLARGGDVVARRASSALSRDRWSPEALELVARVDSVRALRALADALDQQRAQLELAYAAATAETARVLRSLVTHAPFREAMLWQNRAAVHRGLDWLVAQPPEAANSTVRKNLRLIASYLQRYSVKNDTIGFFGPICWGEIGPATAVSPGRELLRDRRVYFEHWAIDAMANAIAVAADTKPFLAPRLLPTVAVAGSTVRYGFDRSTAVAPAIARLLVACDGDTPAVAIAHAMIAAGDATTTDEVYELLDELVETKLVTWTIEPSALVHAERELRRLLDRIAAAPVHERVVAMLDRLEAARAQVSAAAGDVAQLERALAELDDTFRELTGQDATRRAGEIYAARTPLYEDCVRDVTITIGQPVMDRLGPVLGLVAQSARWFTHELAARYRSAVHECYATLARESPGPVRYLVFWRAVQQLLPERRIDDRIIVEVERELDRRWASILALDMAERRVDRSVAELASRVDSVFAAPGPGWPSARHVSPDVLLAARSVDDIVRGAYTLVLGELHLGNTLMTRLVVPHGPDGGDLMRAYDLDVAGERVMATETRQRVTRADAIYWSDLDLDLELGTSRSWRPRDHVLRAADLVVEEIDGSLCVRDLARGRTFDVIAFLEKYLAFNVVNHFTPAPRGPHVPRVTIDGVVIAREQWRLATAELAPLIVETAAGPKQFAAARAWAAKLGLPRWVFVKAPEEPKPIFVDFDSPIYVEMFVKLARKASTVTVSEMLPSPEDAWFADAGGQTYTCELRMVAVDPVRWRPPRDP